MGLLESNPHLVEQYTRMANKFLELCGAVLVQKTGVRYYAVYAFCSSKTARNRLTKMRKTVLKIMRFGFKFMRLMRCVFMRSMRFVLQKQHVIDLQKCEKPIKMAVKQEHKR